MMNQENKSETKVIDYIQFYYSFFFDFGMECNIFYLSCTSSLKIRIGISLHLFHNSYALDKEFSQRLLNYLQAAAVHGSRGIMS